MNLAGGNGGAGLMTDDRVGSERHPGRLEYASNGQAVFHPRGESISEKYRSGDGRCVEIRNVWADNLEHEMMVIRELVETYNYVAMDTEFPGIVARPVGDFNQPDFQYQTLRCNVDMLKMIQLGLSFGNEKGELPDNGCCTWQFNFAFNLSEDMYAHDSIQLLKNSGINFEEHERRGIDVQHFGELLMTSGLVLLEKITWISFHSGYDFGYLLKLLTCINLPTQESEFFEMLQRYFPKLFDIKFLVSSQDGFHGGLNKLAEDLKVDRIGPVHQAGSDSLLTLQVFLKVADVSFNGVENLDKGKFKGKFLGQLYGYGGNQTGIYRPGSKSQQHNGAAAGAAVNNASGNANTGAGASNAAGTACSAALGAGNVNSTAPGPSAPVAIAGTNSPPQGAGRTPGANSTTVGGTAAGVTGGAGHGSSNQPPSGNAGSAGTETGAAGTVSSEGQAVAAGGDGNSDASRKGPQGTDGGASGREAGGVAPGSAAGSGADGKAVPGPS